MSDCQKMEKLPDWMAVILVRHFYMLLMPLTKSSMVALGISYYSDESNGPLIANTNQQSTATWAYQNYRDSFFKLSELMAGSSLIACIPMLVLYLLFQRHFIEGIATSGSKL